ncbi:hypothetical protein [Cryobacterium sp. Y29]|uniref:hypothetical protein n=1 Tax=Cryobacterium sp. Y29 TaxID=2048285 RepID=UPI001E36F67F|nr:hypothetical protein [Cryobacterium sp. Y29]
MISNPPSTVASASLTSTAVTTAQHGAVFSQSSRLVTDASHPSISTLPAGWLRAQGYGRHEAGPYSGSTETLEEQ